PGQPPGAEPDLLRGAARLAAPTAMRCSKRKDIQTEFTTMLVSVTTYYLELRDPSELRPGRRPPEDFEVRRAAIPCPELNRFLYTAVGGDWYWIDRLRWTYAQWLRYLDRPELQTWVAYCAGTPAGYFELEAQAGGGVEVAYFGLLPCFVGQGLGGALVAAGVGRGREWGAGPGTRR